MTSKDKHRKHVALERPLYGEFGRNELAILGAPCGDIQKLAKSLLSQLTPELSAAYVDADHKSENDSDGTNDTGFRGSVDYTDKISFQRIDIHRPLSKSD